MADDRIEYSLAKLRTGDPFKAGPGDRFEIALTNLTADECGEVAMCLLELQNKRIGQGVGDFNSRERADDQYLQIKRAAT